MKPRIRVVSAGWCGGGGWWAGCSEHPHVLAWAPTWQAAMDAANAHARTHRRTDIASHLALRDDHPLSDRRWDTPLPHDLEPPC